VRENNVVLEKGKIQIEKMMEHHWNQVKQIYEEGIATKIATFQDGVGRYEDWDAGHSQDCRLVATCEGVVLGWVALSPVSARCVYKGVAEVSVYIGKEYRGQKLGEKLLNEVISLSEKEGYWTLQSGIIRENMASRRLHENCGFRELGFREKVGKMSTGIWHDVILMERRSAVL
jgi:L-amino acid N-acyltransferase YncA